jgi:hypothetical protein
MCLCVCFDVCCLMLCRSVREEALWGRSSVRNNGRGRSGVCLHFSMSRRGWPQKKGMKWGPAKYVPVLSSLLTALCGVRPTINLGCAFHAINEHYNYRERSSSFLDITCAGTEGRHEVQLWPISNLGARKSGWWGAFPVRIMMGFSLLPLMFCWLCITVQWNLGSRT